MMKGDQELEMLLEEIPYATSGAFSSSSSSDYLPVSPFFQETKSQSPFISTNFPNELLFDSSSSATNAVVRSSTEDMGLSKHLRRLGIRDEQLEGRMMLDRFLPESYGFDHFDQFSVMGDCDNGEKNDYLVPWASMNSNMEKIPEILALQQQLCLMRGSLYGSYGLLDCSQQKVMENSGNVAFSNSQLQGNNVVNGGNCYFRRNGIPMGISSISRYSEYDNFLGSQKHQMKQAKVTDGMGSSLHYNLPSMRCAPNIEAFGREDGIIIQGKGSNYVVNNKGSDHPKKHKNGIAQCNEKNNELGSHFRGIPVVTSENGNGSIHKYVPLIMQLKQNSLLDLQGYIYFLAKDQHGCRFLQQKLHDGNAQNISIIFNKVISHVAELLMNPFGNYLMQKLLDVCNEEQRTQIVVMVTSEPSKLVEISLNMHGTRAVQKLIETLKTQEQVSFVITSLKPRFVDLSQDLNGNHVVQRCLQCLTNEDNKFIFDAAANFCVDIATHQHGCCVLQRCIAHSSGELQETLVAKISTNGLLLAQDAFGNYVVQYILELKIPSATSNLIAQFEGNYVLLSTQKFSSNVIEKCLKEFPEVNRSRIIYELLSVPKFEQLLQDPFANYVIQSALRVSKGFLHDSLVKAIRLHEAVLKTSPYCKRIYSKKLSKK